MHLRRSDVEQKGEREGSLHLLVPCYACSIHLSVSPQYRASLTPSHAHFLDEDTEAQRGEGTCSKPHSQEADGS